MINFNGKIKKGIKTAICALTLAGIFLCSSFAMVGCDVTSEQTDDLTSVNKTSASVSTSGSTAQSTNANSNTVQVTAKTIIENNVVEKTDYTAFNYDYVMYTYENNAPVVKINGTGTKNGVNAIASITYQIDQTVYDSLVGTTIDVQTNEDNTFSFTNNTNTYDENKEETVKTVSFRTPTTVREMTYEQQLSDVVSYLKKKNNGITVTNVEYDYTQRSKVFYKGTAYVEDKNNNDEICSIKEYDIEVEQLIDYAIINNSESGKRKYIFNPKKTFEIELNRNSYSEYTLNDTSYLNMYIEASKCNANGHKGFEKELIRYLELNNQGYDDTLEK